MNVLDLMAKLALDSSEYDKGLNDAEKNAGDAGQKIKKALVTSTVAVDGALVAGAAAAYKFADTVATSADAIDKGSQKLGISSSAYQEWDFILQHSGSSVEAMTGAIKTLTNAATSSGDDTVAAFKAVGLSMEDVANMSQEDLFSAVITGLQGMEEGAERSGIASKLLGKSAMELGPLLNTTAEDTQAMREQVYELGGVMSEDAVKSGAAFKDNLQDLQTAFGGLWRGIAEDLIPVISDLMGKVTEFITTHDIAGTIQKVIDVGVQVAPFVLGIIGVMNVLTGAIAAYNTIMTVKQGIETIGTTITSALTAAQTAFGIANTAALGPILAVIAAITAIIAIIVLCIKHWDEISATVRKVVTQVSAKVGELKDGIVKGFNSIVDGLKDLPNKLKEIATNVVMGFYNGIMDKWNAVKDKITGVFNSVTEGVKNLFSVHSPSRKFKWIGEMVVAGFEEGIEGLNDIKALAGLEANISRIEAAAGEGSGGTGSGGGIIQNIYVNQQIDTADELAKRIRIEAKYGLMKGVSIG